MGVTPGAPTHCSAEAEAERLCRLLLAQRPDDFREQYALGVDAVQKRRLDITLELFS